MNVGLAEHLFKATKVTETCLTTCSFCGNTVTYGTKYQHEDPSEYKHPDCFLVSNARKMDKMNVVMAYLGVEEEKTPEVLIKSNVLKRLVDQNVENFPYQNDTFFSTGNLTESEVVIEDFVQIPFIKKKLARREVELHVKLSEEDVKKLSDILTYKFVNGFLHCHDGSSIGLSDLFYDAMSCQYIPRSYHSFIASRGQLNVYYPTFEKLILLNHERFGGRKPLLMPLGHHQKTTKDFLRYQRLSTSEDRKIVEQAKERAKEAILSDVSNYLGFYTANLEGFSHIDMEELDRMTNDLHALELKSVLEFEEIRNSPFLTLSKGKIKQLPFRVV